jgi:ADP-heptose:LPS heptosyltransferase
MSCLIIKNDGIGDLVLASGLIASLGEKFGGAVDLITCAANREVAEGIEPLRKRYYVSRDMLAFSARVWAWGLLWPRISQEDRDTIAKLRSKHYDVAVCLRRFIRQSSLVLMKIVRADRKMCMWQMPTNASLEMAQAASVGWNHHQGHKETLSELTYAQKVLEAELEFKINPQPRLKFCKPQSSLPGKRKVAIGISGASTNWASGNWIELAMLLNEAGWTLEIFGGSDKRELSCQIISKVPTAINHAGDLTLEETSKRLAACDVYIGNDTGLSHLASLVNKKNIIILGGGTFRRFFPWPGSNNQTIIYHGLECFDCNWQCKYSQRYCLDLVRPSDVFQVFEKLMQISQSSNSLINLNNNCSSYRLAWRQGINEKSVKFASKDD